jgi:hypothetical protein
MIRTLRTFASLGGVELRLVDVLHVLQLVGVAALSNEPQNLVADR